MTTTQIASGTTTHMQRIRGALGEKALSKSFEFFDQGLFSVLTEVLQNARRAGSSRVAVEIVGTGPQASITVRDDGCGIADMSKLVTFGSSDWSERTDIGENAAGMGVFALASRGVTVRSRGHRVALTRQVFCGEADAVVFPDASVTTGTELMFPAIEPAPDVILKKACLFYPLPVTLNGQPLKQHGFFEDAAFVAEWHGLRIGVFETCVPMMGELFRPDPWEEHFHLNFHGHIVQCRGGVNLTEENGQRWVACAEVVDAPGLRLVLPARKEPIQNDFLQALRGRAAKALLECVARQPTHSLAFRHALSARDHGIELQPATIDLRTWSVGSDEDPEWDDARTWKGMLASGARPVLVDEGGISTEWQKGNLHHCLGKWQDRPPIMRANANYAGYRNYDNLRTVTAVRASAILENGAARVEDGKDFEDDEGPAPLRQVVAASLKTSIMVSPGKQGTGGDTVLHEGAADFFFMSDCCHEGEPDVLVTKDTSPSSLATAITDYFFGHSDDAESDSYDRQLENYYSDALEFARSLLLTGTEMAIANAVDALKTISFRFTSLAGGSVNIELPQGSPPSARITAGDGTCETFAL